MCRRVPSSPHVLLHCGLECPLNLVRTEGVKYHLWVIFWVSSQRAVQEVALYMEVNADFHCRGGELVLQIFFPLTEGRAFCEYSFFPKEGVN